MLFYKIYCKIIYKNTINFQMFQLNLVTVFNKDVIQSIIIFGTIFLTERNYSLHEIILNHDFS